MPRISQAQPPAVPSTPLQHGRRERLRRAAARLGAAKGLEQVQMTEVAAVAGVALGTLYRYYPSKHHLFADLMLSGVDDVRPLEVSPTADPGARVAELIIGAVRGVLRHPTLGRAMITSVNALRAETGAQGDNTFRDRIVSVAGIADPTDDDLRLARLVEQTTYGVLTWAAAGEFSADEAEVDLRRACALLLAPWAGRRPANLPIDV
ncbi:MAG: TetR family transcriptional regulator [Nocardioides sp.]